MLELVQQLAARLAVCVVEVDMSVPRRDQESRRGARGEGDGGYGLGGILSELELARHVGGACDEPLVFGKLEVQLTRKTRLTKAS